MPHKKLQQHKALIFGLSFLSGLSLVLATAMISLSVLSPTSPPPLQNQDYYELPEGHPPIPKELRRKKRTPGSLSPANSKDNPYQNKTLV